MGQLACFKYLKLNISFFFFLPACLYPFSCRVCFLPLAVSLRFLLSCLFPSSFRVSSIRLPMFLSECRNPRKQTNRMCTWCITYNFSTGRNSWSPLARTSSSTSSLPCSRYGRAFWANPKNSDLCLCTEGNSLLSSSQKQESCYSLSLNLNNLHALSVCLYVKLTSSLCYTYPLRVFRVLYYALRNLFFN